MLQQRDLLQIKNQLEEQDRTRLSALACLSSSGIRRCSEQRQGHRQVFAQDADRILHSKAYTRYIDKTQVFSLIDNDHITHRVLHVQIVSRIARTIGRFLGLNEDLIEAIALGHDIGHPPFGHEGENILAEICKRFGLPGFQHNIQSVRFLDQVEKKGKGWNLTLQVLDGILCHDGEVHTVELRPQRTKDFRSLDLELRRKEEEAGYKLVPMTLEGCVVRMADTIAYIGRDLEDAIELGFIRREDIPRTCSEILGVSNGTIVYNLVSDLIGASLHVRTAQEPGGREDYIGFTEKTAAALLELKRFNYENIYTNAAFKPDFKKIHSCYEQLFQYKYNLSTKNKQSKEPGEIAAGVRDYIAGMTDQYFLTKASEVGCEVPERICVTN